VNALEQLEQPTELTFSRKQLLEFLNGLDAEFTEKNPHMTQNEFKIFAWTKLRFARFLFHDNLQPEHMDAAELSILKQLYLQGFSLRDSAFALDRSLGSVEARVHSFGTKEQLLKELKESL
jgi:hypothetical protein